MERGVPRDHILLSPSSETLPYIDNFNNLGRKRISPGSIPTRKVRKTQPYLLIYSWLGLMEPARGESRPWRQHRDPAAPGGGKLLSLGQTKSIHLQLQHPGTKTNTPRVDAAAQGVELQSHWMSFYMGGAHDGASARRKLPVGQHRGSTAPGDDNAPYLGQKSLHTSKGLNIRGRKRTSAGSILPHKLWKPQPHLPIQYLTGDHGPCPTPSKNDRAPSPDQKSFHTCTTPTH